MLSVSQNENIYYKNSTFVDAFEQSHINFGIYFHLHNLTIRKHNICTNSVTDLFLVLLIPPFSSKHIKSNAIKNISNNILFVHIHYETPINYNIQYCKNKNSYNQC